MYKEATHLDQQKDPWNRLNMTPTLQSVRRRVNHFDPLAPNDALDFELKTSYDQHADLFQPSNYSVLQRETLNLPHGYIIVYILKDLLSSPENEHLSLIHAHAFFKMPKGCGRRSYNAIISWIVSVCASCAFYTPPPPITVPLYSN